MEEMKYTWPYANEAGQEEVIESDVLVLGGGLAGCFAAQLSQGRQQGCDVKIWNEYQYFTIRPAEDTAFM